MFVSVVVWVAGVLATVGVTILGVFCVLSVLQLAMLSSKEKVVLKYSAVVILKLALGLLSGKHSKIRFLLVAFASGYWNFMQDRQSVPRKPSKSNAHPANKVSSDKVIRNCFSWEKDLISVVSFTLPNIKSLWRPTPSYILMAVQSDFFSLKTAEKMFLLTSFFNKNRPSNIFHPNTFNLTPLVGKKLFCHKLICGPL